MRRARDYEHLISMLCAERDRQHLTNADVARRIPIDRASVSRWLTGQGSPRGHRLVELTAALGYDLALISREDA
jgi:transcriptional regulator with XRE-family HTH domain